LIPFLYLNSHFLFFPLIYWPRSPKHTSHTIIMVRLREIPRTATFAWSPGAASPLIATGTRAGAVDADFSNKTCLELWDLGLDREDASEELQPLAKIDTDSGYDCHPGLDGGAVC
jgi:hypothetical protein